MINMQYGRRTDLGPFLIQPFCDPCSRCRIWQEPESHVSKVGPKELPPPIQFIPSRLWSERIRPVQVEKDSAAVSKAGDSTGDLHCLVFTLLRERDLSASLKVLATVGWWI